MATSTNVIARVSMAATTRATDLVTDVLESCIRGFHIYKAVWNPTLGEELVCETEFGNIRDPYAVAVQRLATSSSFKTVGHVPRHIFAICFFFINRGGNITCQVTGSRRYSADLVQGGLEIPCLYTFSGSIKDVQTIRNLISHCVKPAVCSDAAPKPSKN